MSIACPITVNVTAPPPIQTSPNITAIYADVEAKRGDENRPLTELTIPFEPALNLIITIGWKNTGDAPGSFVPKVVVNGQVVYGSVIGNATKVLQQNEAHTDTFIVGVGSAGTYGFCPNPN